MAPSTYTLFGKNLLQHHLKHYSTVRQIYWVGAIVNKGWVDNTIDGGKVNLVGGVKVKVN